MKSKDISNKSTRKKPATKTKTGAFIVKDHIRETKSVALKGYEFLIFDDINNNKIVHKIHFMVDQSQIN